MAENNFITQIQVNEGEYFLNATYLNGKAFGDYTIDGQSIFNSNSGDISIFKKCKVISSLSEGTTLEPNTKYIFTSEVESLDFKNINWNNGGYDYCEYIFIFSSISGEISIEKFNFPKDWYWSNGEEPFIEPNMRYELSVSVIKDSDSSDSDNNDIVHAILVPFVKVNNE